MAVELEEAVAWARKAVEADDSDAYAWWTLGRVHLFQRLPAEGIAELGKALALDPSLALARFSTGAALIMSGKAPEGIELVHSAIRLSPRDPWLGSMMGRLADAYVFVEDYEEAVRWGREATLLPGPGASLWTNRHSLVSALGHLGRLEEAARELVELQRLQPAISCSLIRDRHPLTDLDYQKILLDGLRKAGLPE